MERTAEEWGRVAVALPGWRWMPGMLGAGPAGPRGGRKRAIITGTLAGDGAPRAVDYRGRRVPVWYVMGCDEADATIDPDDPATAGCLLALLGSSVMSVEPADDGGWLVELYDLGVHHGTTLGRACIAAAEAIGRWPGGLS